MMERYPSVLLARATDELGKLPGVGPKTALRLALHLLKQPVASVDSFADAISKLRHDIKYCRICHNISDTDVCPICSDEQRDHSTICVVENVQDIMAIENTQAYHGLYNVLGGIKEVILALSSTMEGDTTNFYITRQLKPFNIKQTVIARGISVGNELEYTDEVTLGRSIVNRTPIE